MSIFSQTWYTDLMDIWRQSEYRIGNLDKQTRTKVASGVPCRVYRTANPRPKFNDTDSTIQNLDMLACETTVDVQTGDELFVTRGARLGKTGEPERYFAGDPTDYFEPFAGILPQLDHKQVPLGGYNRIGNIREN